VGFDVRCCFGGSLPSEGSLTRGNAFGVRAHGTVTTLDTGEEFDFLAKYQAVLFRTGEVREKSTDIVLR
jgi:hypothetical protein